MFVCHIVQTTALTNAAYFLNSRYHITSQDCTWSSVRFAPTPKITKAATLVLLKDVYLEID